MSQLLVVEIDRMMDEIKHLNMVPSSQVMDFLLDMRSLVTTEIPTEVTPVVDTPAPV